MRGRFSVVTYGAGKELRGRNIVFGQHGGSDKVFVGWWDAPAPYPPMADDLPNGDYPEAAYHDTVEQAVDQITALVSGAHQLASA